jgi:hypothetical protein
MVIGQHAVSQTPAALLTVHTCDVVDEQVVFHCC